MKKTQLDYGEVFENEHVSVFFGNSKSADSLLEKNIAFGHQIHKADLIEIKSELFGSSCLIQDSDGLLTNKKNLYLGIYTADCIPCFIFNDNQLFSLHLGWRSLQLGLFEKALNSLSKSKETTVFIGPHIKAPSFEVGPDVVEAFAPQLKNFPESEWVEKIALDKYKVSLTRVLEFKARSFKPTIFRSEIDTFTSSSYCSYRRQNGGKDRNISFAFLK